MIIKKSDKKVTEEAFEVCKKSFASPSHVFGSNKKTVEKMEKIHDSIDKLHEIKTSNYNDFTVQITNCDIDRTQDIRESNEEDVSPELDQNIQYNLRIQGDQPDEIVRNLSESSNNDYIDNAAETPVDGCIGNANQTSIDDYICKLQLLNGTKSFVCNFCQKDFGSYAGVKRHVPIHLDARPYICQQCGQGFKVKLYLDAHIRGKHGSKLYTCDKCHKAFNWRATLHTHVKKCICKTENKIVTLKSEDTLGH